MSRRLTLLGYGLGLWALAAVLRALSLAGDLAAEPRAPASVAPEALAWLAPVGVGGIVAVLAVARSADEADPYLVKNLRLGVMVAIFAVVLSWAMALFAAYLSTLRPG